MPAVDVVSVDCEARDDWFFDQDVNAWTSSAYVAVGLLIVSVVVRHRLPRGFLALGAVVALEGGGSVLYHGAGGDAVQLLHDVPVVGMLGFVAGWHAGRLAQGASVGALLGLTCGLAVGLIASIVGLTDAAVALLAVFSSVCELAARRRRLPTVWTAPVLALLATAVAAWLAGTADSPLCDASSWLQLHGVWHVLSALVVLAWVDAAAGAEVPDRSPRR
jgi:hypothetical protein